MAIFNTNITLYVGREINIVLRNGTINIVHNGKHLFVDIVKIEDDIFTVKLEGVFLGTLYLTSFGYTLNGNEPNQGDSLPEVLFIMYTMWLEQATEDYLQENKISPIDLLDFCKHPSYEGIKV